MKWSLSTFLYSGDWILQSWPHVMAIVSLTKLRETHFCQHPLPDLSWPGPPSIWNWKWKIGRSRQIEWEYLSTSGSPIKISDLPWLTSRKMKTAMLLSAASDQNCKWAKYLMSETFRCQSSRFSGFLLSQFIMRQKHFFGSLSSSRGY